jgi:Uma2 family endonuclease
MTVHRTYTKEILELFPMQGEWTEEDFFNLPESNRIIELSDGEIIVSPNPAPMHQIISDKLQTPLSYFVKQHDLGQVMAAPTSLRLWPGKVRGPDLLFLCKERYDQIGPRYVEAPVDWIAEIISPGSRKTDTEKKLSEYAQAGIPEYWVLDSKYETISVYVLEDGVYVLRAMYKAGDIAEAVTIPGFRIAVDEVFRL